MYIVFTGGYGFLGAHTVQQCIDSGFTPIVLERAESRTEKLADKAIISIRYTSIDEDQLIKALKKYAPKYFVHMGWKGLSSSTRNMEEQISVNLPFTLKTVELANRVGCQQWIGIGSLSEYGMAESKASEDFLPAPFSIYGKSKLASCWASSAMCQAFEMRWSWIRIGSIYGPGDSDQWLIPYVTKALLLTESPKLTPSDQVWDYLFVSDAAEAIISVVKSDAEGIFNLGSGKGTKIKEVVNQLVSKIKPTSSPLFGALPYSENQIMHMEADITRIHKYTGWKPKTTLDEGLEATIIAMKSKLALKA